jgi:hypothetical protein
MDPVPEIRRGKVFLQPGMSSEEIKRTYGLSSDQAYKAKMKGFFVKNYMKNRSSSTGRISIPQLFIRSPKRSSPKISKGTH